jgi:mannose-6-phosphate isomerase-like protein (cupin superfamily)
VRHPAPTDRALDFQLAALQAEFADMKAQKRASTRLVEGGTFSMNARYLTGPKPPRFHKAITEYYFVRDGSATLVTGGTIVNSAIRGGVGRVIRPGDVVFIPPAVTAHDPRDDGDFVSEHPLRRHRLKAINSRRFPCDVLTCSC